MEKKTKIAYEKCFEFIYAKITKISSFIIVDIKVSTILTVMKCFPCAQIIVVFFHFYQSMISKLKKMGLLKKVKAKRVSQTI